jgi:hypothetical protein
MNRKRIIIGMLAAGLMFTAAFAAPGYGRIVSSAQSFQHCFRAMQSTGRSLGPIERFVYSLVLANYQPSQAQKPRT